MSATTQLTEDIKAPSSVGDLMQQLPYQQDATLTANPWDSVPLTQEEADAALNEARQKKFFVMEKQRKEVQQEAWIASLKKPWTAGELKSFLYERATQTMKKELVIDADNAAIIDTLCMYFTNDAAFEQLQDKEDKPLGYKLDKGLLLYGGVGVGKTCLMKLFARNKRQCYDVVSTQDLVRLYANDGEIVIEQFSQLRYEPKDPRFFFHQEIGTCFDDLGTEEEKQYYGNKTNVMAEIMLKRYNNRYKFGWDRTHITTNCTKSELQAMYGTRIWDRMNEMFNMIPFSKDAKSRR